MNSSLLYAYEQVSKPYFDFLNRKTQLSATQVAGNANRELPLYSVCALLQIQQILAKRGSDKKRVRVPPDPDPPQLHTDAVWDSQPQFTRHTPACNILENAV